MTNEGSYVALGLKVSKGQLDRADKLFIRQGQKKAGERYTFLNWTILYIQLLGRLSGLSQRAQYIQVLRQLLGYP